MIVVRRGRPPHMVLSSPSQRSSRFRAKPDKKPPVKAKGKIKKQKLNKKPSVAQEWPQTTVNSNQLIDSALERDRSFFGVGSA